MLSFFSCESPILIVCDLHEEDGNVTETRFQFKISTDVTMNVPFSCGTTILFNACLLTHRQNIENFGKMPMINVALHCNEKFGRHHCRSLQRMKMTDGKNWRKRSL